MEKTQSERKMVEDIVKQYGLPGKPNKELSVLNVYYVPEKHAYYRIIRINFDSLNDDQKTAYDYMRFHDTKSVYSIESLCISSYSDQELAWATICFAESLEDAQETILLFSGTRDKNRLKQYEITVEPSHISPDLTHA